jgi:hypothetical protein
MRREKTIFTGLILVCLLCISKNVVSQNTGGQTPQITFGGIDRGITTKEKILESRLECHQPGCQVTGFSVIILPKGRDLLGPYWMQGDQLSEKLKNMIKELPDVRNKIFIDSIQVYNNGKKWQPTGMYIQFGQ